MASVVVVEDRRMKKPFLGGWRHGITNRQYLNAASQTGPPEGRMRNKDGCSRAVQTAEMRDANTQPLYTRSTQMWRPDCNVSNEDDRYMTAKPYETYEQLQERLDLDGKARVIQRNYRVYRLLKYIKESAKQFREMLESCRKRQEEKLIAYRERHREEIVRKMYPRSRTDFDMLYDLIERWKRDQVESFKLQYFKAARCANNYLMLESITEMFDVIDRKMQHLKERHRRKKFVRFITENCGPVRWNGYKGKLVEMTTLKNQRAAGLRDIYRSLSNFNAPMEERVELLRRLRDMADRHDCMAAFGLVYLLDQEAKLLSKGIEISALCFLRERILFGYLRFVRASDDCGCKDSDKDPWKNVESEKLRESVESGTKLCSSCWKLHPYRRFAIHGRMRKLSSCIGCTWLRQKCFGHVNYRPYEYILNCIRGEERRKKAFSALSFMMQPHDIYHLVNNIWHGHSVISKTDDLYLLRLIRYNVEEEWSPWNCILLTQEEAEVHSKIKDLSTVYTEHLLRQISLAHQIAKNHFKYLSTLDKDFRESSRYYAIQDRQDYRPSLKMISHYLY